MSMSTVSPPTSVAVLDRAVTWTQGCLELARGRPLDLATPCSAWDLGDLLFHMDDTWAAITEAAEGRVVIDPPAGRIENPDVLVDRIVQRACRTRAAWGRRLTSAPVGVGDLPLGRDTLVLVGALEIAVHGWDVSQACGDPRPIPEDLAARLYDVASAVVTAGERGRRFAAPAVVPAQSTVCDRLLAHLGRSALRPG